MIFINPLLLNRDKKNLVIFELLSMSKKLIFIFIFSLSFWINETF